MSNGYPDADDLLNALRNGEPPVATHLAVGRALVRCTGAPAIPGCAHWNAGCGILKRPEWIERLIRPGGPCRDHQPAVALH